MAALSYHEQEDIENTKRIRGILKELPPFCTDFFRGIEPRTSARTRLAYAYDSETSKSRAQIKEAARFAALSSG